MNNIWNRVAENVMWLWYPYIPLTLPSFTTWERSESISFRNDGETKEQHSTHEDRYSGELIVSGNGYKYHTTDSAQHMCWWLKNHGNEGRPEKTEYHITSNRAAYHKDQDKHVIHKLYFPLTDGHTNEGRQEHNDRTGRQRRPPYRKRHSRGWSMRNKWLADRMWMYWAEFEIGDDGCGNFYLLVRGNAD